MPCRGRMYSDQDGSWKGTHGRSRDRSKADSDVIQRAVSFDPSAPCSTFSFVRRTLERCRNSSKDVLRTSPASSSRNGGRSESRDSDGLLPLVNGLRQRAIARNSGGKNCSRGRQNSTDSRSRTGGDIPRRSRSSSRGSTLRGVTARYKMQRSQLYTHNRHDYMDNGVAVACERPKRQHGRDGPPWYQDGCGIRHQQRYANSMHTSLQNRGAGFGIRGRGRRGGATWCTREIRERIPRCSNSPSMDPEEDMRRSRSREKARRRRQVWPKSYKINMNTKIKL